jgi:hypothetical protein
MPGWNRTAHGYVGDVPVLNREEFDSIEFEAALTGDHQSAAERMSELAATGTQTESMSRAEALIRVGEQWLLAGNADEAAYSFRMAIADGGPVDGDPRVQLCRALFLMGQRAEAYALIGELKSEGSTDARACEMLAELLVEQSDLPAALDWATSGVELMLAGGTKMPPVDGSPATGSADLTENSGLAALLRLRYRIRNDLRLPEDEYDRMLGS